MKHIRTAKTLLLALLLIFALVITGCSSEEATEEGNFSLSETSVTLMTGQTKTLLINDLKGVGAAAYTVYWASDNAAVATVDTNGTVTALAAGTCNVVAAVRSAEGEEQFTCAVTVSANNLQITSLSFKASIYTQGQGQALDLTKELNVTPAAAVTPNLTWTSSNPAIASVTNGIVVPLSQGITTVTATTEDGSLSASCAVQVSSTTVTPSAITFEESEYSLYLGQSKEVKALVMPTNATGYSITWSSSNPAVATVEGGVVTGYAEGTAIITARLNMGTTSLLDECTVTVKKATVEVPATFVGLSPDATTLKSTDRNMHNLKLTVQPANCTQSSVWTTNRPDLIQLDSKTGTFYIKQEPEDAGQSAVLITCTVGTMNATAVVYIDKEASRLLIEPDEITIYDQEPKNVQQIFAYKDKIEDDSEPLTKVTWKSNDEKIATVDKDGNVTAVKIGTTTVTATYEIDGKSYSASCKVTVEKAPYLVMTVGETLPVPENLLPKNPSQKPEDWSGSKEHLEIDPVNKTVKALKSSDGALLQYTVKSADAGVTLGEFMVYIKPAPATPENPGEGGEGGNGQGGGQTSDQQNPGQQSQNQE